MTSFTSLSHSSSFRMWFQVTVLLFAQGVLTQAVTLVARESVGGVKGTVTFTQDNPGEQVNVSIEVSGLNADQASTWQLHTFRLNYDVSDRCSVSQLGPRILESVSGQVTNGSSTISGMDLSGINSTEGRSVVFFKTDGNPVACATVERTGDYITARATFRQTILGHILFRQQGTSLTRVTVDLYSDGSESIPRDLEWRVVEGGDCSTVGTAYSPGGVTGACSSSDHSSCAVGDLSGKMGEVEMGATMGSSRMTSVDLNLPLSGGQSVLGKTVQLFVTGETTPLACAVIRAFSTRTGVATFDSDGVTGTITLTQPSPLDPTTTEVNLQNLRSFAGGYHVHKFPVPQRLTADQLLCSDDNVSGHFNPFGIVYDGNSPGPAAGTEDMYEVGDLSKKYGLLDGAETKTATYIDFNLPLFGTNSVLGRSLVIHSDLAGSPRWVCANIHDTAALTSALATFTFPVIGHVMLQQRMGEADLETSVYYRLDYGDGSTDATTNHSWAIHVNPVGDDMLSDDVSMRCSSAGEVLNPMDVSATNYDMQCQPLDPLRCKMGDLKGKHQAISVRLDAGSPAIGFFTDVNVPLQGDLSVVGKSLVVMAADGTNQTLACANLLKVWPQVAEAKSWGEENYGSVTFSQQVGVVQAPTTIDINLQSLASNSTVAYSIYSLPVATTGKRCETLGNMYNPFEANTTGPTKDKIPVGDLTAKFGAMASSSVSGITKMDPSLDLWGPRGVTGRGFALSSSGDMTGCANIESKMGHGGKLFRAKAVFSGEVQGVITLTQYVYPDGAMTPTTVVLDLKKTSGPQTPRHNWHTHEKTVGDDATASSGPCASTGGHYNPFKVNVKSNYTECMLSNSLRCELGDQSNKLGTYDMGSGPMVASDIYLPLAGPYGVIGRSFVVHTENRGAPRMACADILPAAISNAFSMSIKTPPTLDKAPMVNKIATVINTEPYNVAVKLTNGRRAECTEAIVYFLGMEAEKLQEKFNDVIGGNPSALGMYQPVKECSTSSAGPVLSSLYVLLASLILGYLLVR